MGKRTCLLVSPEPPWPAHGGGPLRTISILEYLRGGYEVDLILFRERGAGAATMPEGVVRRVEHVDLTRHSRGAAARAGRNAGRLLRGVVPLLDRFSGLEKELRRAAGSARYDLVVVEHFWLAPYAKLWRELGRRTVLDMHNIESELLRRLANEKKGAAGLALREFARRCRKAEARWCGEFDRVLVTSEADAARMAGAMVVANTLPRREQPVNGRREGIVMSGNFGYDPNAAAARWFHARVWPRLRREFAGLKWKLLGKGAGALVKGWVGEQGVEWEEEFEDAVERLAGASVAVVPLHSGSGTRLKVLEAWAAGTPVVSTRVGVEGLKVVNGRNVLLADEAEGFAEQVARVLREPGLSGELSRSGRVTFEIEYTWDSAWRQLEAAGL